MICARKQGNVVTVFTSLSSGQPYEITSYDDAGPADAFPMTMSTNECYAKYGKNNVKFFEAPQPQKAMAPGVDATEEDLAKFFQENKDLVQVPVTVATQKPKNVPFVTEPTQKAPDFIDTKFIDDCTIRAIDNEIDNYELVLKYASAKKGKEVIIIIKALQDFKKRITDGTDKK